MSDITFRANPANPCPVCGSGTKGCSATGDGLLLCRGEPLRGWLSLTANPDAAGFGHYRRADDSSPIPSGPRMKSAARPPKDLTAEVRKNAANLTAARGRELTEALKLPDDALDALRMVGWNPTDRGGCWTFPETDAAGNVVGFGRRFPKPVSIGGGKPTNKASIGNRGLTLPLGWRDRGGPVCSVEGPTDTVAMTAAELSCVGRPSNSGGAVFLAELFRDPPTDQDVIIVGENDQKENGDWPGRTGAESLARRLAADVRRPIRWALPPVGSKDVREWLTADARGATSWADRGRELLAYLSTSAMTIDPPDQPLPVLPAASYKPFPVHLLPERVAAFVAGVGTAVGVDAAFASLPALSALGAAIGTARALAPKSNGGRKGWLVFPTVWAVTVGRSSAGKSPPLDYVNNAVQVIEDELGRENDVRRDEYRKALAAYKAADDSRPEPSRPADSRFRIGDVTSEGLVPLLADNPRGLWLYADEAAGWLSSFDMYRSGKGGADRARWLSVFDSRPVDVDRKTGDRRRVSCRRPLVCVAGTIQPAVLRELMTPANVGSGLFARVLLAAPPGVFVPWTEDDVPDATADDFAALLRELRALPAETDAHGNSSPRVVRLSAPARPVWLAFRDANRHAALDADTDAEDAAIVKLEAYALKFALIFHTVRHVGELDPGEVSAEDMAAGAELAGWFVNERTRVGSAATESPADRNVGRLVELVGRKKGGRITPRALQRHNMRKYKTAEAAESSLDGLVSAGWGTWEETRPAGGGRSKREFVLCQTPGTSDARHAVELSPTSDTVRHSPAPSDTRPPQSLGNVDDPVRVSEVSCVGQEVGSPEADTPPADTAVRPGERVSDTQPRSRRFSNDERPHDQRW